MCDTTLFLIVAGTTGGAIVLYTFARGYFRQSTPKAQEVYVMKWFQLAKLLIPIVGAVVPGAAPLTPFILAGIESAQRIPGATNAEKAAHVESVVLNGAAAVTATGKVNISAFDAVQITQSVFSAVDHVNKIISDNSQNPPAAGVSPNSIIWGS